MSIPKKIIKFLDKAKTPKPRRGRGPDSKSLGIKYEPIEHRTVFTAFDRAQTLKIPQKIVGKTLAIKIDRDYALVLIPANKNLDKGKLKKIINGWQKKINGKPVKNINFVTEVWMKKNLKGIRIGAIPPFGTLWKIPTFVDRSLMNQPKIIIAAGDYNYSIKINPINFKKIMPGLIVGSFIKRR